jgi:DNA-binding beta-propeller fold protein YncE
MTHRLGWSIALALVLATPAVAAPPRSSAIAVAPDGHVFVVNPDSNTVSRLEFDAMHAGTLTHEAAVGKYPRTLAVGGTFVFVANQKDNTAWRLDQADLGNPSHADLGVGCNPYGVAVTGSTVLITCQGTSELLILGTDLSVTSRVKLAYPNARGVTTDGTNAWVTHYLTEEPGDDVHVSVVDLGNKSVKTVFTVQSDRTTCETQNSGHGPLNLVSGIALMPAGAPAEVAGQLWIGGVQENNFSKGLYKRSNQFKDRPGATMFEFPYAPFVPGGANRNTYRPSFHDIARFGIYKLDATDGHMVGKIDIDEANIATDIQFSDDGTAAYAVDVMFHTYHVFNTVKGQRANDVTTIFAPPSSFGPGGADPTKPCVPDALSPVTSERPFRMTPEAQITTIDGFDPADVNGQAVKTGLDFDTVHFMSTGVSQMRAVPDGIGSAPMGVGLSPDGETVYVVNYLARNVVPVASALPLVPDPSDNTKMVPENLRCTNDITHMCGTTNDCSCPSCTGFCNHPGGASCHVDADCGTAGPCLNNADCIPVILGAPVSTITPGSDPVPAAILDGKILFNTAARDSSVPNQVGLGQSAPLFNHIQLTCAYDQNKLCEHDSECGFCATAPATPCTTTAQCGGSRCVQKGSFCADTPGKSCNADGDCPNSTCEKHAAGFCANDATVTCTGDPDCSGVGGACQLATCSVSINEPGEVVSTAHDASYVACSTCHADFGGQDGRTWDFSQFGASIRNTMDLRGRPSFAPGKCQGNPATVCTFDAQCGDGDFCVACIGADCDDPARSPTVPPNIQGADRHRYFNPMLTVHWNGDRDEVEDFENTFRQLMGSGDCDTVEDKVDTCLGALIQRSKFSSSDPVDVDPSDLGRPNRNIRGPNTGKLAGIRLTHMADFVYSLTEFVENPNQTDATSERGRKLFNDPLTQCSNCHNGGPGPGKQFFTDKKANPSFDPGQPARGDVNNPFTRHDVGTGNLFDQQDPYDIADQNQTFQNPRIKIPGHRGPLGEYVTPVLNDLWNTAPYLHDGSAHTLLDVIRPCDSTLDDCLEPGRGRNLDDKHGVTHILTPQQLNDLVAFQKTLSLATVVGTNEAVLSVGTMDLKSVTLAFPKPPKHAAAVAGKGKFKVAGVLSGAPGAVDFTSAPTTLSIATPGDGVMEIVSRAITMKGKGKHFSGKSTDGGGTVTLSVKAGKGGTYRFTAAGSGLDLSALATGNQDLTVSIEAGGTQFVRNRNLSGKKNVFKLPKGK